MSEHVHNRLAVVRAERKVSRAALAEAVGAHYQTIGYIERGQYNPSLDLALRIAAYFRLPVEALFSLEPFRPLTDEVYGTGSGRDGADATAHTGRSTG
ncbi:helix-turn-helix transcriptional regulator [Streptomyces qinglanensis]|uniref:DNA-binding transcriptional regulator, XRE-family HTH domain n=1 Tax=Streptomyces qinglanensis TaxID=943816 RepID=A0A1H9VCA5_9ACTN|nr:helix-turn-helix transcriptional regulator [Streptomyces qinglanensis]SES19315.1 DNA-binding transcriptional regulator, XRE-family HTH domain [Streptomyces qinglanensis]